MTTYDALAEVGKILRNLIWKYVSVDPVLNVDITSADINHAHPASADKGKLCIFLYRMGEDPYRRDNPWDGDGTSANIYNDRHFTADPEEGIITFGKGDPAAQSGRGRVPIGSSIITVHTEQALARMAT